MIAYVYIYIYVDIDSIYKIPIQIYQYLRNI